MNSPELITFDVFGTIVDWRTGLVTACAAAGRPVSGAEFDRVIGLQSEMEHGEYQTYAEITRQSLQQVLGMEEPALSQVVASVGEWPLFPDSRGAIRDLIWLAPCAAMTNSDRVHGERIQERLGFPLTDWLSAEETQVYKPDPRFWDRMAKRRSIEPGRHWWHVSAYADYDLAVATELGLTTVFVRRPHARPSSATHSIANLSELAGVVRQLK